MVSREPSVEGCECQFPALVPFFRGENLLEIRLLTSTAEVKVICWREARARVGRAATMSLESMMICVGSRGVKQKEKEGRPSGSKQVSSSGTTRELSLSLDRVTGMAERSR